ncbi:hypothetical protein HELRODRAFT_68360 [Helobdella robusta]|uniref:Tyrosine-protein phosphatase domain-containing protein n=1 Tax=Helobdella robusta TaxID=6412 RepID=T1FZD7_HELRO|nr:hypothetical protein HELRODRAFT_68360 [Helobdella robusta]ESN96121.1 hypothetical protein HELRODRAFT_68360 [Helobdella robusta]
MSDVSCSYAKKSELKKKNRYRNIVPFDHNRVKLKMLDGQPSSDYINASFIPSYRPRSYLFIGAQGVKRETLNDFWRMVVENETRIIVMLTMLKENNKEKCLKYWPDADEKKCEYGGTIVKFLSLERWLTYEIRKFSVKRSSVEFIVTHMWYTAWPDHGVPENIGSLLNFRYHMWTLVSQLVASNKGNVSNVLVHCSAGVGRTGTLIGLDYLLEQSRETDAVDVAECLLYLRSHRNFMIQTLVSEFCYHIFFYLK